MAVTREILGSHPASVLKKEISKTNIKGYSKMKKEELIELMMKNRERFGHIKMAEKKARATPDRQGSEARKALASAIAGSDKSAQVRKSAAVKPKPTPKPRQDTQARDALAAISGAVAKSDKSAQVRKTIKVKPTPAQKQEAVGLAQQLTGKTSAQLNQLDPAALFGLLPTNLRLQILDPKQTGVKVAQKTLGNIIVENEKRKNDKYDPNETTPLIKIINSSVIYPERTIAQFLSWKNSDLYRTLGLVTRSRKSPRDMTAVAFLNKYNNGETRAKFKDLPKLLGNDLPEKLVEATFSRLTFPSYLVSEVPNFKKELLDIFAKNLKESIKEASEAPA